MKTLKTPHHNGVAVLFAHRDSVYKTMPGCDVWDIDRDARLWPGGSPLVAHPPCRAWGRMRHLAKPREDERGLARWSVGMVRQWGGVLEHPAASTLWPDMGLPRPGRVSIDGHGGFSIAVLQKWWGHRADKATWLYVCGIDRADVPVYPINLHEAPCVVASSLRAGDPRWRPHLPKSQREHTPAAFAEWLVALATITKQ